MHDEIDIYDFFPLALIDLPVREEHIELCDDLADDDDYYEWEPAYDDGRGDA